MSGLPRAAVLAAAPVLVVQGRRVRRSTPRLSGAQGSSGGTAESTSGSRLVVLGDSVAAGVGVDHHDATLAGRLALRLAARWGCPVAWEVVARSGATSDDVRRLVPPASPVLAEADVAVVSVGVNDVLAMRSDRAWRASLGRLLDDVLAAAPSATVAVLGVPPMGAFPALPRPLRQLLGGRSRRLDAIGTDVCDARDRVRRVPLSLAKGAGVFAEDRFHPSALTHARLAREVDLVVAGG